MQAQLLRLLLSLLALKPGDFINNLTEHGIELKEIPSNLYPYMQKEVINEPVGAAPCLYHQRCLDVVPIFRKLLLTIPEKKTKIVSVGSGCGEEEQRLIDELGPEGVVEEVVCVDPDPQSFPPCRLKYSDGVKDIVRPPKYATVQDLLKDEEDRKLFQNCILWLDWPSSDGYDFEALRLLQPLAVVVRYEKRSFRQSATSWRLREELLEELLDYECNDANYFDTVNREKFCSIGHCCGGASEEVEEKNNHHNDDIATQYHLYQSARLPFYAFWLKGEHSKEFTGKKTMMCCFRVDTFVSFPLLEKILPQEQHLKAAVKDDEPEPKHMKES